MKNQEQHIYGFDLYLDLKNLYGDNFELINKKRKELYEKLTRNNVSIEFKSIIQNPIPIKQFEINDWINSIKKNENNFSENSIEIFKEVYLFLIKYHLK